MDENIRVNLGKKLKTLRKINGIDKKDLAAFIKVDKKYITKLESGIVSISTVTLEKILNLYGYDMNILKSESLNLEPKMIVCNVKKISCDEMETIAAINRIALNSEFMQEALEGQERGCGEIKTPLS